MADYRVVVLPKSAASRALSQVQTPVRKEFWKQIAEVCGDVPGNSKWTLGAEEGGQMFHFKLEVEGRVFYCAVAFKFADSKDESTLLVTYIHIREV